MSLLKFHLVNVFAESGALSGNALCVFEPDDSLDEAKMQALALQFNLSETTFVQRSDVATARIRIYTPSFEMPFAGHPTLGSAHVVRQLFGSGDAITLQTGAGVIPVRAQGDVWSLRANAATTRPLTVDRAPLAAMLGISEAAIAATPLWVNAGNEQLLVPVRSAADLAALQPSLETLSRLGSASDRARIFSWTPLNAAQVQARFFFRKAGGVAEDYGTGSACANLGAYLLASGVAAPFSMVVTQGESIRRVSTLRLNVDAQGHVFVSGKVVYLGSGSLQWT